MKRNMDLIRELLFIIEARSVSEPLATEEIAIDGYDDVEIGLHLNMMHDAGFLVDETFNSSSNPGRIIRVPLVFDLSWKGHDYLSSIRDPAVWKKTKSLSAKVGNASFDMLTDIAKAIAKQGLANLGLPTGG